MGTSTLVVIPPNEFAPVDDRFIFNHYSSTSGSADLRFQQDGNLVVYDETGAARWASNTAAGETSNPGSRCVLQADGNLVVYDVGGTALWASGTQGHPNCLLFIQNDGNVVLYDPFPTAIWATNTVISQTVGARVVIAPNEFTADEAYVCISAAGEARLIFQADGNLVVYDDEPAARWASNTAAGETASPGSRCVLQEDGNLVVYDADANAVWASGTEGHPNCLLFVQDDGNVVLYDPFPNAIWATNTAHLPELERIS